MPKSIKKLSQNYQRKYVKMLEDHNGPQNDHSSLRKNTKNDNKLMRKKVIFKKKRSQKVALEIAQSLYGRHLQNQEKMGKEWRKILFRHIACLCKKVKLKKLKTSHLM